MSLFGNSRPPSLRSFTFSRAKPEGNFTGVLMIESWEAKADLRMLNAQHDYPMTDGIMPALRRYLAGISRAHR